ncbi:hypothetical protein DU67_18625 [Methanosarcina mazei]|uniref:Uncharacterized protein n=3 Tax=Methanosarcina mazei TaxID=2209 RepID=A0A0F8IFF1_METMZ|nr:hypothetical protein DU67_18625 [Methanosarcina mazei]
MNPPVPYGAGENQKIKRNRVECNRVECNRVECNRVECNRVECNRVESNRVKCNTAEKFTLKILKTLRFFSLFLRFCRLG